MHRAELLDRAAVKIQALHVGDLYGDAFEDFRSRYKKESTYRLYVQFTSHASDPLERNPYGGPLGHSDPAAVYGYPIEYILKHPADVWYGTGARYLRVLRDRSRRKLVLTHVTADQSVDILQRMDIKDQSGQPVIKWPAIEGWLRALGRKFSQRVGRTNRDAKLFFLAAQQVGPGDETVLSGADQTARFRRAGFDALEDVAKRPSQAVINDREPAQIAFLTRHAFEVVETVHLHGKSDHVSTTWNTDRFERKLAAQIADVMDDRLAEGPERSSLGGWSYWWTRKGRRIETMVEKDQSYYEKRMGEKWGSKPHKSQTVWTPHHVKIVINTEFGRDEVAIDSDERTKELWRDLKAAWTELAAGQPDPDWQPEDHATWKQRDEARRRQQAIDRILKQEGYKVAAWDNQVYPALVRLAGHDLDFQFENPIRKIGQYDQVDRIHGRMAPVDPAADQYVRKIVDDPDAVFRAWVKEEDPDVEDNLYVRRLRLLWEALGPLYRRMAGQQVPADLNGTDWVVRQAGLSADVPEPANPPA